MMRHAICEKRRRAALCLAVCFVLSIFSGCTASAPRRQSELWVVTEQTTWDRMNGQLEVLKKEYEETHENVSIRIDYLPTEKQEREVYLQFLRTQILRGGGPDCYLLPTDNTLILDEPSQYTYKEAEPLFPDVELAMRGGLFFDITKYYEEDDALCKDDLNPKIMDAGVVNGIRYVLPLRYDIPVIYAQNRALEEAGIDPEILTQDICALMEAFLQTQDPILACGLLYEDFSAFSDFIDYDFGNTQLDAQALRRYMEDYQKLKALLGFEYSDHTDPGAYSGLSYSQDAVLLENLDIKKVVYSGYDDPESAAAYYPVWIGSMQDAFDYVPLSVFEDTELSVVPLRAVGGDVVADVTYYAAVGSGCDDPALAYDFLRQFLLEESQWEQNRPKRKHTRPPKEAHMSSPNASNDLQYPGLIENGWPVRDQIPIQKLWNIRRMQIYVRDMDVTYGSELPRETKIRMRRIGRMQIPEDRIPSFDFEIGQVRFRTTMSDALADALSQLNDPAAGYAPTQADLEKTARQLVWELSCHASEG